MSLSRYSKRADRLAPLVRNLDRPFRLRAQLAAYVFKGASGSKRGGVAYPTDWEAGQFGAVIMVELMMKKRKLRADFDAAKAQIRRGLALAQ